MTAGNALVWPVDILHGKNGQVPIVSGVAQGDSAAGLDPELVELGLVHVERDGHADKVAICKTAAVDNAADGVRLVSRTVGKQNVPVVVLLGHEAWIGDNCQLSRLFTHEGPATHWALRRQGRTFERRETAIEDQLEIAEVTLSQNKSREGLRFIAQLGMARQVASEEVL